MPRWLSHEDLEDRGIRKSKSQRARLVKAGLFPAPVKCGARNVWIEEEIEAWQRAQAEARPQMKTRTAQERHPG